MVARKISLSGAQLQLQVQTRGVGLRGVKMCGGVHDSCKALVACKLVLGGAKLQLRGVRCEGGVGGRREIGMSPSRGVWSRHVTGMSPSRGVGGRCVIGMSPSRGPAPQYIRA
eukprot:89989-Chlamydomonas_euryale.AAC.3